MERRRRGREEGAHSVHITVAIADALIALTTDGTRGDMR